MMKLTARQQDYASMRISGLVRAAKERSRSERESKLSAPDHIQLLVKKYPRSKDLVAALSLRIVPGYEKQVVLDYSSTAFYAVPEIVQAVTDHGQALLDEAKAQNAKHALKCASIDALGQEAFDALLLGNDAQKALVTLEAGLKAIA